VVGDCPEGPLNQRGGHQKAAAAQLGAAADFGPPLVTITFTFLARAEAAELGTLGVIGHKESDMELIHLQTVIEGLDSLAEIEKDHPKLGAQLLSFTTQVGDCCQRAYDRLSDALGTVRGLPAKPSSHEIELVLSKLNDAPSSKWFKEVAGICDQLAALAEGFEAPINEQLRYTSPFGENFTDASKDMSAPRYAAHYKIAPLLSLLQKHERELKDDLRTIVAKLQATLGRARDTGDVEDARAYALAVQEEISTSIDHIKKLTLRIAGGSSKGASAILSPAEIAESALRRPERVLILNMLFVFVLLALAATVFQFLAVYQFILATGFAITAVVVINALYLRSIDKLSEENFLKLVQLALLKFFAPLTRRGGK
jgi:hypothetical protein